jgi:PTH2 family peptidyl-tRNA hydrolase
MPTRGGAGPAGYKMVLVVRGELRLTCGKAAVQVAHAAVELVELARRKYAPALGAWRSGGQKKIAVVAPRLEDLQEIERQAKRLSVPSVTIQDAGMTEVPPGTVTVLGLGPAPSEVVDRLTGELPLL